MEFQFRFFRAYWFPFARFLPDKSLPPLIGRPQNVEVAWHQNETVNDVISRLKFKTKKSKIEKIIEIELEF